MFYRSLNESSKFDSTDDSTNSDSSRSRFTYSIPCRLSKSVGNTSCSATSASYQSDSSLSDSKFLKSKKRSKKKSARLLPPIGVFWDIENCQVPKNKSASSVVTQVRERFFKGYREAEFIVVCDVKKENAQVVQDLHDAQVNLIHVSSVSKNAADEKLRQSLRRFAEVYPAPSAVVLISGDINFAADLSDLRYRKKIHVILVHYNNVADALILCANETYNYSKIIENIPAKKPKTTPSNVLDLSITNLPVNYDKAKLKNRLKLLSDNCGGKVVCINPENGTATLRFSSVDFLNRAQKRLKGEDVYGFKIKVSNPTTPRESPCRNFTERKMKNADYHPLSSFPPPPSFPVQDSGLFYVGNQSTLGWKFNRDRDQELPSAQTTAFQDANIFRAIRGSGNMLSKSQEQIWNARRGSFNERRSRTPDDTSGACAMPTSTGAVSNDFDDNKIFYQGSSSFRSSPMDQTGSYEPVNLIISNLDPTIDVKDLRNILINLLKEYIIAINITNQADGTPMASVKVGSPQEAQFAISQLHHYKLGYKRLTVSYAQNNTLDPGQLGDMVIGLLQEVPGNRMPLFMLLELLESRFHTNVSLSEVNKLKNICKITEERTGRIISLMPDIRTSPTANISRTSILYCSVHSPNSLESKGWGEPETSQLPNIIMPLKLFASKLNDLLDSHMGTVPLLSLPVCYEFEFGDPIVINESGVPLEHLVTCVANIELKYGGPNRNIKYIKREIRMKTSDNEKEEALLKGMSPAIVSNIQLLCRELVDLLKTTDRCQLLLSRFIPAYHHHFGRQCRVADYGYTKLVDLLESQVVSNVVQILGYGTRRTVTLTHNAQMRRFTSDLLRVLKTQMSKQLLLTEFPSAYERALSKPFVTMEYGLCTLEDLLEELPENAVVINRSTEPAAIAIPKREQTAEEMIRTKQFSEEVVKLLCHSPQCSMLFNKFVPAYHHHFGHQCKVSDYGFSKLIELFEAIPDTVKIEELVDGERIVRLTLPRALKVLGSQITDIIKQSKLASLPLEALVSTYLREYGYPLKPKAYDCQDIKELVLKLSDFVQITQSSAGPLLVLMDMDLQNTWTLCVWSLLMEPPYYLNFAPFINQYRKQFKSNVTVSRLEQLSNVVTLINNNGDLLVHLTPLYILAAQIYEVLNVAGGQIQFTSLEGIYRHAYGKLLSFSDYGFDSWDDLFSALNFMIAVRKSQKKVTLQLNKKMSEYGIPVPSSDGNQQSFVKKDEFLQWPPPSAHDIVHNGENRGITPPKPDTPPAPGTAPWSTWHTPTKFECSVDLSIHLPAVQTPKLMGNPDMLISPTRNLLSAHPHPLGSRRQQQAAPDPAELPMPDKLLGKGIMSDDSNDSGVINYSNVTSENEMDLSNDQLAAKQKVGPNYNKAFLMYNL